MSDHDAAPLIPAATILLCNDRPEGIEIFMVVRHHQIDFASGALVFPGGKAAPEDGSPEIEALCDGLETVPDGHLSFMVAAIREAFEESGVLLARQAGSDVLIGPDALEPLDQFRDPLARAELPLLDFLKEHDLRLALDTLRHFAYWITPTFMPKRFDTHFYIADAPEGQIALHDGSESVDSVWITARKLLKEADEGKWVVIFPTRCNLELLSEFETIEEARVWAAEHGVTEVLPWIDQRYDGPYLCIPKESGYPTTEEKANPKMVAQPKSFPKK